MTPSRNPAVAAAKPAAGDTFNNAHRQMRPENTNAHFS
jgi:hypothetical protein